MFGDFKDGDRGSMMRFGRGQLPEGGGVPSIGSRGFYDLGGLYGHKPPLEILPHNPTETDEERFLESINGPSSEVPPVQQYDRTLPTAKGQTRRTVLIDGELLLDLGAVVLAYSKSSPGSWHEIIDDTCSCEGYAKWDKVCRHLRAARKLHDGTDRVGMLELPVDGTVPIPQRMFDEAPMIHEERDLSDLLTTPICPECNERPVATVLGVPAKMCGRCAVTPKGLGDG